MELDELEGSVPISSDPPRTEIHAQLILPPPSSREGSSQVAQATTHNLGCSNTVPHIRQVRLRVTPRDFLPEGIPVPDSLPQAVDASSSEGSGPARRRLRIVRRWTTKPNAFGLWREYYSEPSFIPDLNRSLSTFQSGNLESHRHLPLRPSPQEALGPFPNYSTFLQAKWLWQGDATVLGAAANKRLVDSVYSDPDFRSLDVVGVCFTSLREKLAEYQISPFLDSDKWKETAVRILVPLGPEQPGNAFPASAELNVSGLQHRSIVDVVKRVLTTDPNVVHYHLHPFRQYLSTPGSGPEEIPKRVVDDIYNSDAMLREYEALRRSPREPGCPFERVILALQFWSDATQLANFGTAKLWPIYMYFGNQPKWARSRPDMHACHDIAHIPSLPDSFQDFVCEQRGFPADARLKTHCKHELFHAVWRILLDKKFIKAYKHGILIKFPDGTVRRVYLRIITYSADYPEKVLIVTIRNLGTCLCPRCLIQRHQIRKLGLQGDAKLRQSSRRIDDENLRYLVKRARYFIYDCRKGVTGAWVQALLRAQSLVPTINAFSSCLSNFGFNYFDMLCSDFMHEFELGEWKTLLTHLIRMLFALGEDRITKLDERLRKTPPFGRDTIRRINYNVSELKQLAARDFEDILQCAIPAFEGLFPDPIDNAVQELLFILADWHALAKLRLHTDSTLTSLELATRILGQHLRHFADHVANTVTTRETPRERAARVKRAAKKATEPQEAASASNSAKEKPYTLDRYKLHALGDYPDQIRLFGTLDVTSTQLGEARHRQKKRQYAKTNKRDFEKQIAKHTTVVEKLRFIEGRVNAARGKVPDPRKGVGPHVSESPSMGSMVRRYWISEKSRVPVSLSRLLQNTEEDAAFKHFQIQLVDHIIARLRDNEYSWDEPIASTSDHSAVELEKDRIYAHGTVRFNYTTYDIRRGQDTIKPSLKFSNTETPVKPGNSGRSTIMLVADETDRQASAPRRRRFWYARVLGIFHCHARDRLAEGSEWKKIDFLWIRWMGADPDSRCGLNAKHLERVGYVPDADGPGAFGFIDPADVIRACHIVPAFHHGTRSDLLSSSLSVAFDFNGPEGEDYEFYYVQRFSDRDMAMRHRGGGVGHIDLNQVSRREEYSEPEMGEEANASAAGLPGEDVDDARGDEADDARNASDFETDEETDDGEMDSQPDGDSDEDGDLEEDLDDD